MIDRKASNEKARAFFEDLWNRGDPWNFESSEFEDHKYERQLALLTSRRYKYALEIGCGAGSFTRRLSTVADRVLALDIATNAITQAQQNMIDSRSVEYRVANIMEFNLREHGPWDLVVLSETIYYLGWLYSFFDLAWMASELFEMTSSGGELLMANTRGGVDDYLLRPWIIQTYRDLFLNVGYALKSEEVFSGSKDRVEIEVLMSLFTKPEAL